MQSHKTIIGSHIHEIEICESTSKTMQEWLNVHCLPEGTVLISNEQSAGRGQGNNRWSSEPGKNLTFSFVLYPENLNLQQAFVLNMAVTLGVVNYLKSYFYEHVKIKWPNDLLVNKKKIAGILFENTIREQKVAQTVIGIGLNVNQQLFPGLPDAVSLSILLKKNMTLANELKRLLNFLDEMYAYFKKGNREMIREEYARSLLGYHETGKFFNDGREFNASIVGVASDGKLALHEGEKLRFYSHQDVKQGG